MGGSYVDAIFRRKECIYCGLCCQNTEMILLKEDIERLTRLGFRKEDFTVFKDGYMRLKNVDGHCFFYDSKTGLCKVYKHRPLGCRIYPVIWVEGVGATVDNECPLSHTITHEELKLGIKLLKDFLSKLKREYA